MKKIIFSLLIALTLTIFHNPFCIAECPISYYVSIAGDDTNNCLLPGSPCETIQHVIDVAIGMETCPVTIHVAAGTYSEHLVMDSCESLEGGWNSDFTQRWDFENDGLEPDPAYATIIDGARNGTCLTLKNIEGVAVEGFRIQNGFGEHPYNSDQYFSTGGGAFVSNSSVNFKHTTWFDNFAQIGLGLLNDHPIVEILMSLNWQNVLQMVIVNYAKSLRLLRIDMKIRI